MIMLAPSLGVERIIFADTPPPGVRTFPYLVWALMLIVVGPVYGVVAGEVDVYEYAGLWRGTG